MDAEIINVLLVEDDPGDARLIQEMLLGGNPGSFNLQAAGTLKDGIRRAEDTSYHIILLDLSLPDSTGLDTLYRLHTAVPQTPIVVLTGLDDMTVIGVQAVKDGAQDYLIKHDVDSKLLRRSIRYALERHEIDARLRRSEEEYRSLIDDVFDTSAVAVIILDADFHVVWSNEATEIYFGVEREHILGRNKRQLVEEEIKYIFADPEDFAARLREAYTQNTKTRSFECHVLPEGDRAERWLEHWSQPIRDGMYRGGRIEHYTDITERKILEFRERAQRDFAEALRDIAMTLTSTLDLDNVLGRILNNLDRIVPHDTASITMIEDDHLWVARQRSSRDARDTEGIEAEHRLHVEYRPYLDTMMETHQPLLIGDLQQDDGWQRATEANVRAYLGAPILLQQENIGFINLLNEKPASFDGIDSERLTTFAGLAAIAIQNARLFRQTRELAALEERQRLARDLHDSVSQTIFTCRTMLESASRRFDTDPARARELVEEVHQLAITALSEMRILLLELRPTALIQVSLKELFEQYLQPIQSRRRFDLELAIDDVPALPGEVQIALYRITQEALNNIDKHAQAANVRVHVFHRDGTVEVDICDDGKGFEVNSAAVTSLGLNIMRERAAEIGAQLAIESAPGEGTCIRIRWTQQETQG